MQEVPISSTAEQPAQKGNTERKAVVNAAVCRWRVANPDKYRALCRKSSHTYYTKNKEIICERRRIEREAERYVLDQSKLATIS
jgi:hypothetical protein|nr:MAG: hypothetical protein [Lake Baikal virophage 2]